MNDSESIQIQELNTKSMNKASSYLDFDPQNKNGFIVVQLVQQNDQIKNMNETVKQVRLDQKVESQKQNGNHNGEQNQMINYQYLESKQMSELMLSHIAQYKDHKITKVQSLDQIFDRFQNNYYPNFRRIYNDLKKLLYFNLKYRCLSQRSKIYLQNQWEQIIQLSKKYQSEIENARQSDLFNVLFINDSIKQYDDQSIYQLKNFRKYTQIDEYLPVYDKDQLLQKLNTQMQSNDCTEMCVCLQQDYVSLGDINLIEGNWKSECINRQNLIECDHKDEQLNMKCLNRSIANNMQLKLDQDVKEDWAWGLNLETKYKLAQLIGDLSIDIDLNTDLKFQWVQDVLLKSINLQEDKGHDIRYALDYVIQNQDNIFSQID